MSTVLDIRKSAILASTVADYIAEVHGSLATYRVAASGGPADISADVLNEEWGAMEWWLGLQVRGTRRFPFHPGWGGPEWILHHPPLPLWFSSKIVPGTGIPGEHYGGYLALLSMSFPQGNPRVTEHGVTIRHRIRE